MVDPKRFAAQFQSRFGDWPQIYRAPGRVNLMGDHTDYNDGFVLPAAIGFQCWAAISKRADNNFVIFSENLEDTAVVPDGQESGGVLAPWSRYPQGVIRELRNFGYELSGANLSLSSEVPMGAGLSSSAAIEVSAAYALLGLFGHKIDPLRVARLCQRAENDFVGARCGIMDQFTSCHGQAHHALFLDCRTLEYRTIRMPDPLRLVICNTLVERQLGSNKSQYNTRRGECEEGVLELSKVLPNVQALRDVTLAQLEKHRERLSNAIYKRCRHVITENDRVRRMASALETDQRLLMKDLMHASHLSLRDDYEVSCRELDLMVQLATQQEGVYGSRMTGAGFGGCTVNMVLRDFVAEFQKRVSAAYLAETGQRPEIYVCEAADGAGVVHVKN